LTSARRTVSAPPRAAAPSCEAGVVAAWAERRLPRPLVDSANRVIQVVYPGRFTSLAGPDFRDALLALPDGTLLRGDVEAHTRTRDWYAHHHDRDPAYNQLVLHLVARGPAEPVRLASGALVPSVIVPPLPGQLPLPSGICCPSDQREAAAAAVSAAGVAWLAERAAQLDGEATCLGEDEAAWRALAAALGYGGNSAALQALAEALPWAVLEGLLGRGEDAPARAQALFLGAAGLAHDAETIVRWRALGAPRPHQPLSWQRHGVRPANQPAARLRALAELAVSLREMGPARWLHRLSALDAPAATRAIVAAAGGQLGADRARTLYVNVVLPFLARTDLPAARARLARAGRLPENAITRAMAELVFTPAGLPLVTGAQEQQGLLAIYRRWCRAKDCPACPVGRAVTAVRPEEA
jgi:hypothetical protein